MSSITTKDIIKYTKPDNYYILSGIQPVFTMYKDEITLSKLDYKHKEVIEIDRKSEHLWKIDTKIDIDLNGSIITDIKLIDFYQYLIEKDISNLAEYAKVVSKIDDEYLIPGVFYKRLNTSSTIFTKTKHLLNTFSATLEENIQPTSINPHELCFRYIDITDADPKKETPFIDSFLSRFEEDDRKTFITFIVKTIKGEKLKSLLHITGEASTGKSQFINNLRTFIGHEQCATITLEKLNGNAFHTSKLIGKRLITIDEMKDNDTYKLKGSAIKSILGNDFIDIEKKGKDATSSKIPANLIVTSNYPYVSDFDKSERDRYTQVVLKNQQDIKGLEEYFKITENGDIALLKPKELIDDIIVDEFKHFYVKWLKFADSNMDGVNIKTKRIIQPNDVLSDFIDEYFIRIDKKAVTEAPDLDYIKHQGKYKINDCVETTEFIQMCKEYGYEVCGNENFISIKQREKVIRERKHKAKLKGVNVRVVLGLVKK